jgi:hypothetical protein
MLDFIRSQNRKVRCDWKAGDDMEILRFEDQGPSAPHRKKSSRGFLVVGLIATLFGISSAFASSTITINTDNKVNLGQGVVKVSGCDESVDVVPSTKMEINDTGTPTFFMDKITISNIDTRTTGADGYGCAGKTFDIQIFHEDSGTKAYTCGELQPVSPFTATYELSTTQTLTPTPCSDGTLSFTMPSQSIFASYPNPIFTLHFVKAPSDISYITLVSRS